MWSRKDLASDVQALHFPQRPKSQAGGRGEPLRLRSRPPLEGSRQNSHPGGDPTSSTHLGRHPHRRSRECVSGLCGSCPQRMAPKIKTTAWLTVCPSVQTPGPIFRM